MTERMGVTLKGFAQRVDIGIDRLCEAKYELVESRRSLSKKAVAFNDAAYSVKRKLQLLIDVAVECEGLADTEWEAGFKGDDVIMSNGQSCMTVASFDQDGCLTYRKTGLEIIAGMMLADAEAKK